MLSTLYAVIFTLLLYYLSLKVIKCRRRLKISLGDGGSKELLKVSSAHANAVENIPIFLILLFSLELNQGHWAIIHTAGIMMLIARILHAWGILKIKLRHRVRGMQLSVFCTLALAAANLYYLYPL